MKIGCKARTFYGSALLALFPMIAGLRAQQIPQKTHVDLPTSKQLSLPAPGNPQRTNSLPATLAVAPGGRWAVSVDAGYGTRESGYMQSLSVVDLQSGVVHDVPEARTLIESKQSFFSGLAFSPDAQRLYVSLASLTQPEGNAKGIGGSGVAVYDFDAATGAVHERAFYRLPLVKLAGGKTTLLRTTDNGAMGVPYPAALAVLRADAAHPERLLIAENLSDSVAEIDSHTGALLRRWDLSSTDTVPSTYPIALAVTADGRRAFVALWNASEVDELDLESGKVRGHLLLMKGKNDTAAGSHPCALVLDDRRHLLYVALSNRDAVAAVDIAGAPRVRGYFDTRLPGQSYFGAEPDALALNERGDRLYAANLGTNSVAVLSTARLRPTAQARGLVEPLGFVPTEWMPTALAVSGGKLIVATGKGKGTGPNAAPQVQTDRTRSIKGFQRKFTYVATLLYGSVARLDEAAVERDLRPMTAEVVFNNRSKASAETIQFAGRPNPIKHVIYIIRENRTYDQILGDLQVNGKPVGNGDPSLTMYGADITPNMHKLVLQFGLLDNFFDSAEVSGDGHVWSTAAIGTDYLERTWQIDYRGRERSYDYEGMVSEGYPLLQHIPDVNEAQSGYLWTNLAAHGKSLLHFGEYISSTFCNDKKETRAMDPQQGAVSGMLDQCPSPAIKPGEAIPEEWGGGKNVWPWAIPRLARNIATKPELVGHFVPETPDFNLRVPDQIRVNIFLRHLEQWKRDRAAGHDTMPAFVMLRLANDHTEGTKAGAPTPQASVADNDLAVGRAVEAISNSAYWDDTAFFILEDDAQNGGDHVDSHRSLGVVISKYAPHAPAGAGAFVDSRFYSTVSIVRTMETLLGVPPMNNNDAFASLIGSLFTGPGDQPAFKADTVNRDNGMIFRANRPEAPGAAASAKMDFRHPDRADAQKLNMILWRDARGEAPLPVNVRERQPRRKDDDD